MDSIDDQDLQVTDDIPGDVNRRQFLIKSVTAMLGGSAAAALLEGCGDGAALLAFAIAVRAARERMGALQNLMLGAGDADPVVVAGWIDQLNGELQQLHPVARDTSVDELRHEYDPDLKAVTDWLEKQGHLPTFTGNAPQFEANDFLGARTRADEMLLGWDDAQRREIWAFLAMFALLNPLAANATLLQFAGAALALDTGSIGLQVYEAIFGGMGVGMIYNPSLLLTLFIPFIVLLLLGWGEFSAQNLGVFVPAFLAIMLMLLVFSVLLASEREPT